MSNGKHILLIDDDVDMHEVVRLVLEPLGHRVSCAMTIATGWQVLLNDRPDLLLLDVMLATPTEGLEFAARIRSDGNLGDLPIIIVSSTPRDSGFEDPGVTGAGRRAANLFLEKPLDAAKLRQAVMGLLESARS